MKEFRKLLLVLLILCLVPITAFAQGSAPISITILHLNDFHGRLLPYIVKSISDKVPVSGAAYISKMIQDERAKNPDGTILLSAGDMFQGTPISNIFKGEPVIEWMNQIGFEAMTLGNHEFDWGMDVLNNLKEKAKFPFLSSNVKDSEGGNIVKPYTILEKKGLKIAVIGVTTPETAYITKPDNVSGLEFLETEDILPDVIEEVKSNGADLVILLSHLGFDTDKELAKAVSGIDVIVGGHSHTVVIDPVVVGNTIIVQAGDSGVYLGELALKIDPAKKSIVEYTKEKELKTVFAGPENKFDEDTAKIVDKYNSQLKEAFAEVVGESTVDLVRNYNEESNIGDLICDAMREATSADIAFQNSGGIRTDLPKGKLNMEQVYTLLPFDNVIITMDLTGRQILALLEQSATLEKGILQVSGIKVKYDMRKPVGSRVVEVLVGEDPLDEEATYRVATNDFLAAGGDKFVTFKEGQNLTYGDMLRDVFAEYLKDNSPVSPSVEGRSIIIK
jgi:2',3'-cyclic-nucleotide 2'-phosphodiesterase (5'-nucleotidase family)